MSDGDGVDISPEPVSDATGELEGPEPLIDEEVPATPRRAPWPVAVLAFAIVIFVIAFCWLRNDEA